MWAWLVGAYAVLVFVLIGCAGFVALFVQDEHRSKNAYRVLRLVLTSLTGAASLAAALMKLHQADTW